MDILERENLFARANQLEDELYDALLPLEELPMVTGIRRGVGALAAVQLDYDSDETLPPRAVKSCREAGVLTRAIAGGGLQVSPPLTMTKEQVEDMASRFKAGLLAL